MRKGIILAGGSGSRLYPVTIGISKQLLPIYDKPMIYYPLSTLMLSGIKEILIITTPHDNEQYKRVLGDGSQWGVDLRYAVQPSPDGLAQAFLLGKEFLNGDSSALILGDNIFFGNRLQETFMAANQNNSGATIFGYHVDDPSAYGVIGFDNAGRANSIVEKPTVPASNYAITGLYFVDGSAPERARILTPSARGELEITSLLESYLIENQLKVEKLGRGFAWLDTGLHNSLLDAGNFVRTLTERQGLQVGSPDEVAFRLKLINAERLLETAEKFRNNQYGKYLKSLIINN
jgi:glucose-1-phosphate thymidylyltransferase